MLKFDAETAKALEIAYQGADFTRRRRVSFDAVDPVPGEVIADVGCGNGMLTAELARAVGETGQVIGVDPSADMHALWKERCADYPQAVFREGLAGAIPIADASLDKAVSVQVFEYLSDIPGALSDIHRALKPGGRVVISDMDFNTWNWASDDPARMQVMIDSWDHHFTERSVPALLPRMMADAGFADVQMTPVPFADHRLAPDGLAGMMMRLMEAFALQNDLVAPEVVAAWRDEQLERVRNGRFYFAITHVVTSARKVG